VARALIDGYRFVVDIDVVKFVDRVTQDRPMAAAAARYETLHSVDEGVANQMVLVSRRNLAPVAQPHTMASRNSYSSTGCHRGKQNESPAKSRKAKRRRVFVRKYFARQHFYFRMGNFV
jgi:hypothetical protein